MKTRIYKPIAVVALTLFALSLNAQNIKSVSLNEKPENQLFASISKVKEDLNTGIMKLIQFYKFNPGGDASYSADPSITEIFNSISGELEKEVRFHPEESLVNINDALNAIKDVKNDLEMEIKYSPSQSLVNSAYNNPSEFTEILTELSESAKFQPTNIQ